MDDHDGFDITTVIIKALEGANAILSISAAACSLLSGGIERETRPHGA